GEGLAALAALAAEGLVDLLAPPLVAVAGPVILGHVDPLPTSRGRPSRRPGAGQRPYRPHPAWSRPGRHAVRKPQQKPCSSSVGVASGPHRCSSRATSGSAPTQNRIR